MQVKEFADAWLGGLEKSGILAVGAADEFMRRYRSHAQGRGDVAGLAEFVVGILAGDDPSRVAFLNPSKPIEVPSHVFAKEAMFLKPLLTEAGFNGLAGRFSLELTGLAFSQDAQGRTVATPGRIAGRIVGHLFTNRPDHRFLKPELRPPISPAEKAIADVLGQLQRRGILRSDLDTASMAAERDWVTLGLKPRREAAKTVLTRLATSYRDLLAPGASPGLEQDDPIFGPRETPERTPEDMREELARSGNYSF
jgi:hypothetical protein